MERFLKTSVFVLILLGCSAYINAKTLKGTVLDETAIGIPGVTLKIVGSSMGTITDIDGNFVIEILEGQSIIFSFIGYESQTVAYVGQESLTISLNPSAEVLEEFIAVGYGTQKKVNLTGAIQNVNTEQLESRALTNASLALQGQISGVQVTQLSGQPGEDQAQIRIRGVSTFENNNDPLVIIDGLEGEFGDVDPKDIATMTVLKDASSAAIYGNKAASGVVIITTKTSDKDFSLDYTFTGSVQEATRLPDVVDAAQYMELYNEAQPGKYSEASIEDYRTGKRIGVDWYDEYFDIAPMQKHHFRLGLGQGKLKSTTSFSFLNQDGVLSGTSYENFNYRTNISTSVFDDKLKLDISISGYRDVQEDNYSSSEYVMQSINRANPTSAFVKKYDGTKTIYSWYASYMGYKDNNGGKDILKNKIANNYNLTYTPLKGLNFKLLYGFYFLNQATTRFKPVITTSSQEDDQATSAALQASAQLTETRNNTNFNNLQFIINYDKVFRDNHSFKGLLGSSYESYEFDNIETTVKGFSSNVPVLDFGESPLNPTAYINKKIDASFFGRLNYSYRDRYLFEMNLRTDGSSRFQEGHRWGVFPSLSAGWRLSEEDFWNIPEDIISYTKIRASYGLLGNANIYTYYAGYDRLNSDVYYSYGDVLFNGMRIYAIADDGVTWETTSQANIGVDTKLFNTLNISADYFYKYTYDILARVQVSHVLGSETLPYQNIGSMINQGWELGITYRNKFLNDKFSVNTSLNLSGIKNELVDLTNTNLDYVFGSTQSSFFSGTNMIITQEGMPYGSYYGYQVDRVFQVSDFTQGTNSDGANIYIPNSGTPYQAEGPQPGDLKFRDISGPDGVPDGKIDEQYDRTIIGNQMPKINYSFNLTLAYRSFDFNFLMQGIYDVDIYNGGYLVSPFYNSAPVLKSIYDNRWTVDDPSTENQRIYVDKTKQKIISDYYVKDGSFLRIKNIELGYTLPKPITQRLKMSKFRVYGNVQNPFLFAKTEGFDPEKVGNITSSDYHPQVRIYSLGLTIGF